MKLQNSSSTKTRNGMGYLEPGEPWPFPTVKTTIRLPQAAANFIRVEAESKGTTLAWMAGIFAMQGLDDYIQGVAADRREERKQQGYWKRSLRRLGIEPTE